MVTSAPEHPLPPEGAAPDANVRSAEGAASQDDAHAPARPLLDLFEERVTTAPDATAVLFEEEAVTYAELDARADRLAHLLAARGPDRGRWSPRRSTAPWSWSSPSSRS